MKYTKKVLENGLKIITVPMKDAETAIAMVLVEAGADYEDKNIDGLSHFLEHMCFKGTKNRTNAEISLELDSVGSVYNAFTGEQYTGYYAKGRYKDLPKLMEIIADIYLNPIFPEKDIDIERGVIIEEINMYEDMPRSKVFEIWKKLLYKDQPAGFTVLGPKSNIQKFKSIDFQKYHTDHYVPEKTVFVIAGNIEEIEAQEQVEKYFGTIERKKSPLKTITKIEQSEPEISLFDKKTDQSHIVVGFRSFDLYDDRNPSIKVLNSVLAGGFSSRLFKKMREELGLCYYVNCYKESLTDRGEFFVNIDVGNNQVERSIEVVLDELKKVRDEIIPIDELEKAKNVVLGNMATGLETSDMWAMYYGFQELHHEKIETPEEFAKKIRSVSAEDVQKIAKEIIRNEGLNLAIVGPHKDEDKFKKILKV